MLLLLKSGADPNATNSSGNSSLGLAASHISRMQTFIDVRNIKKCAEPKNLEYSLQISNQLVIAGCTGSEADWEVLAKHPRRKLVVMMELSRTAEERISLRST